MVYALHKLLFSYYEGKRNHWSWQNNSVKNERINLKYGIEIIVAEKLTSGGIMFLQETITKWNWKREEKKKR